MLPENQIRHLIDTASMVSGHNAANLSALGLDVTAGPDAFVETFPAEGAESPTLVIGGRPSRYYVAPAPYPVVLGPGEQVSVYTNEVFKIPPGVRGRCYSTGTMNTMGIGLLGDVVMHPGWEGRILLVIRNHNRYHSVSVLPGAKIGHVQFSTAPSGAQYDGSFQHIGVTK